MSVFVDSSYKDKVKGLPSHELSPHKKQNDPEYSRNWSEYIYTNQLRGRCGMSGGRSKDLSVLRAFSNGQQPSEIYKIRFADGDTQNPIRTTQYDIGDGDIDKMSQVKNARKHYMNVDFEDIFSPAPKFIRNLLGKLAAAGNATTVTAIDKGSVIKKHNNKWDIWTKARLKKDFNEINKKGGLPPEDTGLLPESLEELELYDQMGGFKLRYEVGMEKALIHTEDISNFPVLAEEIRRDLITVNAAAMMDIYDFEEQKVKYKYIDPLDLIIDDFDKPTYFGYVMHYSISELRLAFPDMEEEEFLNLAKNNEGRFGNPSWNDSFNSGCEQDIYSDFKIAVLYSAWKTYDNHPYTTRTNKAGKVIKSKEPVDKDGNYKVYDKENRKTTNNFLETIYHSKWVIGSKYVFEYGRMNNVSFDLKTKRATLPIHARLLKGRSMVDSMLPMLNHIQMTYIKLQNAIAQAPPPGLKIDLDGLTDVKFNDKNWGPLELIRLYTHTGNMIYRGGVNDAYMDPRIMSNTANDPIEPLTGGLGTAVRDAVESFEMAFQLLAELTGVDRVSAVSQQDPRTSATETKIAALGTSDTLQPIFAAWTDLKKRSAQSAAIKVQVSCITNKDKDNGYWPVLGEEAVESIAEAGGVPAAYYGITISPAPTAQTKLDIREAVVAAVKTQTLSPSDSLLIMQELTTNNGVNYATQLLAFKEARSLANQERLASDAQNRDAGNLAENNKLKSEQELAKIKAKGDVEIEKQNVKNKGESDGKREEQAHELLLAQKNHEYKMLEIKEAGKNTAKSENKK